ncbi:TfoX/Sxy family protein [Prolixibacteraceae bacterium Z1-6]|uniref:TfoX/Sxy family protein n=1 Tax=Draconibacterium aestuarii TaxID=2998507 RepID=A0A9X3F7F9_9BACT|nr:TfoX/Sxy family protein [Prolixibacteraceae bacterium Z1-6]
MVYNEFLADRVRSALKGFHAAFEEKLMFGGICFLVDEKMCVGIIKEDLMVRIDPENQEEFLQEPGCRIMDFTRRPMKGYLYVDAEGVDMDEDLDKWVKRCLDFNPKAKSGKKKKAK